MTWFATSGPPIKYRWALPLFDNEAVTSVEQVYQRADAFLFGRKTYDTSPATGE